MILDNIMQKRKEQLERAKTTICENKIIELAKSVSTPTKDFKLALMKSGTSFICEVKKASPSKGIISQDFNPIQIAKEYEKAGADAISVLTEEFYFKGCNDFLTQIRKEVSIPLLRKDFIIDPYQIYEARVIGADAILLIASLLSTDRIIEYKKIAKDLGLHCLVEVHNEDELQKVIKADCDIIGINNRNLKTFDVSLETTSKLSKMISNDKIIVSESGITSYNDIKLVQKYNAKAVLIGETLMRSKNIAKTLKELKVEL